MFKWWHRHKWPKWSVPFLSQDEFGVIVIQRRECPDCGRVQISEVRNEDFSLKRLPENHDG